MASSVWTEVSRLLTISVVCGVIGLGFHAGLLQLALGNFQLVGDHLQIALEIGVGLFRDGQDGPSGRSCPAERRSERSSSGRRRLAWSHRPSWNCSKRNRVRPIANSARMTMAGNCQEGLLFVSCTEYSSDIVKLFSSPRRVAFSKFGSPKRLPRVEPVRKKVHATCRGPPVRWTRVSYCRRAELWKRVEKQG